MRTVVLLLCMSLTFGFAAARPVTEASAFDAPAADRVIVGGYCWTPPDPLLPYECCDAICPGSTAGVDRTLTLA